jgi:hypothetical protein
MASTIVEKKDYKVEEHIIDVDEDSMGHKKVMFSIIWDQKNKRLDKRYEKDYAINFYDGTLDHRRDYSYVKHIKKHLNWEEGNCIYFFSKQNVDGAYFLFMGGTGRDEIKESNADFCIDESGYWRAKINIIDKYWSQEDDCRYRGKYMSQDIWLRINCKFNDKVLKELKDDDDTDSD